MARGRWGEARNPSPCPSPLRGARGLGADVWGRGLDVDVGGRGLGADGWGRGPEADGGARGLGADVWARGLGADGGARETKPWKSITERVAFGGDASAVSMRRRR